MNEEIRRRERVIRIFPNDDAAMRLIGALLAEKYEEWQTMAKYFDMTEFWEWNNDRMALSIQNKVVEIIQ